MKIDMQKNYILKILGKNYKWKKLRKIRGDNSGITHKEVSYTVLDTCHGAILVQLPILETVTLEPCVPSNKNKKKVLCST